MGTTNSNAINYFSPAKYVVSTVAGEGTHTTIASAISSASSGDTIVIMPGTYTENPTLKAGVNLCAFGSDSSLNNTGNVNITGKCTFTGAGTVTLFGIELQTNSDYFLAVTGSAASVVNLNNCYLNCSNNTGIDYTSSSGSSSINCNNCTGNLGTTGIGYHSMSGAGGLYYSYCTLNNSGVSTTQSSNSAGVVYFSYTGATAAFATSSSGVLTLSYSTLNLGVISNTTPLTTAGTGSSGAEYCQILGGSASALSIGANTTFNADFCDFSSSATNCLTGAGTLVLRACTYNGSSHLSNVTTQTGGAASGLTQGTAPSAGMIGEQIRAVNTSGTALSNNSPTNITSINLTPGVWDVSAISQCNFTSTSTEFQTGISSSTGALPSGNPDAGGTVLFNNTIGLTYVATISIPSYRVTLSATTMYYLVSEASFTAGAAEGYGRISGTRVG